MQTTAKIEMTPTRRASNIAGDGDRAWRRMVVEYAWLNSEGFIAVKVDRGTGHTKYTVKLKGENGEIHARLVQKTGLGAESQTLQHNPEMVIAVAATARLQQIPIRTLAAGAHQIRDITAARTSELVSII